MSASKTRMLTVEELTSGKGDVPPRALRAIEQISEAPWLAGVLRMFKRFQVLEYARYLVLKAVAHDTSLPLQLAPSGPVEVVWHAHMLLPQEYFAMARALFGAGVVLEHDFAERRGEPYKTKLNFTIALYETVFGRAPPQEMWPRREMR